MIRSPNFVKWYITNKCNLRCIHCLCRSGRPHTNELTTDEIKRILDELADLRVFSIIFTGGEPLTRDDFSEILEYASKKKFLVEISTNGVLIDQPSAKLLEHLKVHAINLSLHGSNPKVHDRITGIHGSFEKTVNTIRLIKKYTHLQIRANTTLMKENLGDIDSIIELCEKFGVDKCTRNELIPLGRASKIYESSHVKQKAGSEGLGFCSSTIWWFIIDARGYAYPCSSFLNTQFFLGDLKNQSVRHVWRDSKNTRSFREATRKFGTHTLDWTGQFIPKSKLERAEECKQCPIEICGGGCRGLAYRVFRDVTKVSSGCSRHFGEDSVERCYLCMDQTKYDL